MRLILTGDPSAAACVALAPDPASQEEKKRKREKEHGDTEGEADDFDPGKKVEVEPPPDRPVRACRTQAGECGTGGLSRASAYLRAPPCRGAGAGLRPRPLRRSRGRSRGRRGRWVFSVKRSGAEFSLSFELLEQGLAGSSSRSPFRFSLQSRAQRGGGDTGAPGGRQKLRGLRQLLLQRKGSEMLGTLWSVRSFLLGSCTVRRC